MNAPEMASVGSISSETLWRRRAFEKQLLNILPHLLGSAIFLVRNKSNAEDLVQDTVVRALRSFELFKPGSNIKAWTFRILHNFFINSIRRQRSIRFDQMIDDSILVNPNQDDHLDLKDVLLALQNLTPTHREVITMVRVGGLSYEEAAVVM